MRMRYFSHPPRRLLGYIAPECTLIRFMNMDRHLVTTLHIGGLVLLLADVHVLRLAPDVRILVLVQSYRRRLIIAHNTKLLLMRAVLIRPKDCVSGVYEKG
jgi:hypothetical protein